MAGVGMLVTFLVLAFSPSTGEGQERGGVKSQLDSAFMAVAERVNAREQQSGRPVENALSNLARRSGSDDLELVVTAILVQMTVGGNLAGMLETIAFTIRERVRIQGEISAATAQGRMSGWIVTGMPIVVAGIFLLISPSYFRPMTQQLLGWIMLGVAGGMILMGNFFIRKMVKID